MLKLSDPTLSEKSTMSMGTLMVWLGSAMPLPDRMTFVSATVAVGVGEKVAVGVAVPVGVGVKVGDAV